MAEPHETRVLRGEELPPGWAGKAERSSGASGRKSRALPDFAAGPREDDTLSSLRLGRRLGRGARRRPLHGYRPSSLSLSAAWGTTKAAPAATEARSRTRTRAGVVCDGERHPDCRAGDATTAAGRRGKLARGPVATGCRAAFSCDPSASGRSAKRPRSTSANSRRSDGIRITAPMASDTSSATSVASSAAAWSTVSPGRICGSCADTPPGDDCAHSDSGLSSWVFPCDSGCCAFRRGAGGCPRRSSAHRLGQSVAPLSHRASHLTAGPFRLEATLTSFPRVKVSSGPAHDCSRGRRVSAAHRVGSSANG